MQHHGSGQGGSVSGAHANANNNIANSSSNNSSQQQLPGAFALGFSPSTRQRQHVLQGQGQRQPWPAAMFSLPGTSNSSSSQGGGAAGGGGAASSTSLTSMMPALGLGGGVMGLHGPSPSSGHAHTAAAGPSPGGPTAAAAAAAAAAGGGESRTPVGSPIKGMARGPGSAAAGASGLASPPSWFSPTSRVRYSDRFIPSRAASARLDFSALDREVVSDQVNKQSQEREDLNPAYNMLLRSELLGCQCPSPISPDKATALEQMRATSSPGKKILRFKSGDASSPVAGPPPPSPFLTSPVGVESLLGPPVMSPRRPPRKIPRAPYKVLDAPALADDFYLNLVDWSAQNLLAVGLDSCVYLWSAHTSKVTKLCDLSPGDSVCSVSWSQRGTYLSVGTNTGEVQIWDVTKLKRTRTMTGHRQRVGTQAWNSHMLASGSRDKSILLRDVRLPDPFVERLAGHRSEVCGLKWSPDDRQLASGGNDNALLLWQAGSASPLARFSEHTAAVKALAWSPHQHGLLASGGGTADRCIRFWNTSTNAMLNCVDTGSQVCNLAWSRNVNELVSAHGYSQNQIIVWRYPSMAKLATLTGHSYRVLYLALAPDGQSIVTGAGDETLRFWSVFPGGPKGGAGSGGSGGVGGGSGGVGGGSGGGSSSSLMRTTIR